tara:strand:+ start:3 stop:1133 length:1131 start_codon:yes stop_codon:yes gene_type:complete
MFKTKKIMIKEINGKFQYPIVIGRKTILKTINFIKNDIKNKKVFIIYDDYFNLKISDDLYYLKKSLSDTAFSVKLIPVKSRDKNKNLKTLTFIINEILKFNLERNSLIITFGGGVVGDIGGFVSSILLRGINYVQIPTTLLAQVDSSIGGKTGINTSHGKNLVGSFYQPKCVIVDTQILRTLPKRELYAGLAEVIKYSLILDKNFFNYLKNNYDKILTLKEPFIEYAIHKSCKIKSEIVSQDEKEHGIRALLNLGHTFAHAFESELRYKPDLLHGEAVAIGICMAFRLSRNLDLCKFTEVEKVENLISTYKLPTSINQIKTISFKRKNVFKKLFSDKKVKDGKLTFILCTGIGKAIIKNDIDEDTILKFLKEEIDE